MQPILDWAESAVKEGRVWCIDDVEIIADHLLRVDRLARELHERYDKRLAEARHGGGGDRAPGACENSNRSY